MNTVKPRSRLRVAAIHLGISLLVALLVAFLVFGIWYPAPYAQLTGGWQLFLVVIAVDLVVGPLLTLLLANPKKSHRELTLDLTLVALLQLGALGYGLYSVAWARPVVVSFERDRMAVVTATEIDVATLSEAPTGMQSLPWNGIMKIGLRRAKSEQEFFESVQLGMEGIEPSLRPNWWLPYAEVVTEVKEKMLPVQGMAMDALSAEQKTLLQEAITKTGLSPQELYYLPLVSKYSQDWLVLMNAETEFVGYAPVNGFDVQEAQDKAP